MFQCTSRIAKIIFHFSFLLILFLLFPPALQSQEKSGIEKARYVSLVKDLTKRGVVFEERKLFVKYGSFSSSIHIVIHGSQENSAALKEFVVAVPLSCPSDFPFALAMAFIEKAGAGNLPFDVRVAFLGDETSALPPALRKEKEKNNAGFQDLCSALPNPETTAILYFDIEKDDPQTLCFTQGAKNAVTPLQMVEPLPNLCQKYGIPFAFSSYHNALFLLGIADGPDVFAFAEQSGANLLFVADKNNEQKMESTQVSYNSFADMLIDYAFQIDLSDIDTNYALFPSASGGKFFFIPDNVIVAVLLAGSALFFFLFLIIAAVRWGISALRWKTFFSYLWIIFILFGLLVIALAIVTACVSISMKNIHGSALLLLNIMITLPLYRLFSLFTKKLKIPGRKYILGYAAILAAFIDFFLIVFLRINLLPIAGGALLCIVIGAVSRNIMVSYIMGIMTVFQSFDFFLYVFKNGTIESRQSVIITALMIFPIALVFQRADFLMKHLAVFKKYAWNGLWWVKLRRPAKVFFYTAYIGLCLFMIIRLLPFYNKNFTAFVEQKQEGSLNIQYWQNLFLERRNIAVSLKAEITPIRFDIYLQSNEKEPPFIYAASFNKDYMPYKQNSETPNQIDFSLGENPPNPFNFELTVESDFSGFLSVSVVYYNPETLRYERREEKLRIGAVDSS